MPAIAFGLKKNLGGTVASSTSGKDEDASPTLGHSEVSAVENSPGDVMKPEVDQDAEKDREISALSLFSSVLVLARGTEKTGDVLDEDPAAFGDALVGDSSELEEQAATSSSHDSGATAGDGEVLAGESSDEEVAAALLVRNGLDIIGYLHVGPVTAQDLPAILVELALADHLHPGPFEAEVDSTHSAERAADLPGHARLLRGSYRDGTSSGSVIGG
jgi:hypothetical protein